MYIETDKFSNDIPELFKLNLPLDPNFDLFNGEVLPSNVNGAILFASTDKNRIITADYYSDRLNIYDLEMNLLEQKNGHTKIEPEYFTPDGRKISFANGLYWRSFYPSAFNSDYIYLLYVGINGINSSSTPIDKNPVEIWRIDWNGNLLERIKTDVFLTNISIDQNAKAIYGTTWNSSGAPPKLIRLNLDVND